MRISSLAHTQRLEINCHTTESRINDSELQMNRNELFDLSPTDESRMYNEVSEAFEAIAEMCVLFVVIVKRVQAKTSVRHFLHH